MQDINIVAGNLHFQSFLFFVLLSMMRKLLKRSSNTWTYGMSSANRLRAPTARRLKPLLSMIIPQRPARMITSSMPIIR
jgi:hypothetical protein